MIVLYTCVLLSLLFYRLISVWNRHFLQFYMCIFCIFLYLIWFVNCEFFWHQWGKFITNGYDTDRVFKFLYFFSITISLLPTSYNDREWGGTLCPSVITSSKCVCLTPVASLGPTRQIARQCLGRWSPALAVLVWYTTSLLRCNAALIRETTR